MPNSKWQEIDLRKELRYIKGKAPSRLFEDHEQGTLPYLSPEYLRGNAPAKSFCLESASVKVKDDDLILLWDGSNAGEVLRAKAGAVASTMAQIVFDESGIEPTFFYYFLKNHEDKIRGQIRGSGVPHVDKQIIGELPSLIPLNPAEQRAIADILSTLDEAIAQSESLVRKYQSIKRGLMSDLLTRGVDEVSQTHLVDSVIGDKPANWKLSDVRREFDIEAGFTLGQQRRPRKNTRKYLRVANVPRWDINLDDLAEIEVFGKEMTIKSLRENDLLVIEGHANPNEIGRCAIVRKQAEGLTFQNHIFRLRTRGIDTQFALIWLNSDWVRGYWRNHTSTSSGLYTINRAMLEKLPIPIPSKDEQEKIADVIFSCDKQTKTEENLLNKLRLLKQGLMQDLLSGQVRVKV